MNYAEIKFADIANGPGVRTTLFVSGCRNHCPFCLSSKHVDILPGDRQSDCGGILRPVGVDYKGSKGWMILHRCEKCGYTTQNKAAVDTVQPDDLLLLTAIANQNRK